MFAGWFYKGISHNYRKNGNPEYIKIWNIIKTFKTLTEENDYYFREVEKNGGDFIHRGWDTT